MSSPVELAKVLSFLESKAPSATAETWDNVGLLAGDPSWRTTGAVVSVDLTRDALEAALRKKVSLIVTHHPSIFPKGKGLNRLVPGEEHTLCRLLFDCIREGVGVVACHTNFDRCALEVVDEVSRGLGVAPKGRLHERSQRTDLVKLAVFVPETHMASVRKALCEAGAGHVGNYDFCSFAAPGEGSFRGGVGTDPFLGKPGELEFAKEMKLETVFPRGLEAPVLGALFKTHPYEEVAYDLYAVEQAPGDLGITRGLGYGFWGEISETPSFSDLLARVRNLFGIQAFMMTGTEPKRVRRVAFAAGKSTGFLHHALALDVDVMITGEVGYHAALESARNGMVVLELGHRESECFFPKVMSDWLADSQLGLKTFPLQTPKTVPQRFLC